MPPQPPTAAAPVHVLPWLAQPLTPLLWVALGGTLLVAAAAAVRVRRSSERCPLSPRWLAVACVLTVGVLASISLGLRLVSPVALYVAPALLLISTIVAWAGWHSGGDERAEARATAGALAAAAAVAAGLVLSCQWLLHLGARNIRWDLDLGFGVGEAICQVFPALLAAVVPLGLLPAGHARTAGARRAVVIFAGCLVLLVGATAASALAATMTPLPYESPLSDRYVLLNAMASLPPVLGAWCVVAAAPACFVQRGPARALLMAVAALPLWPIAHAASASPALVKAFDFQPWRFAAAAGVGLIIGGSAGAVRAGWPVRVVLLVVAMAACGLAGDALASGAASSLASTAMKFLVTVGLFVAAAAAAPASNPEAERRPLLAGSLAVAAIAVAVAHAAPLALRADLSWQARQAGAGFDYGTVRHVGPEMRKIVREDVHAIHEHGNRWVWVVPQFTWWTRSGDWFDALLVEDRAQPGVAGQADVPKGYLYRAVITGPDRKRSDVSFIDAQYVGLVEPAQRGQQPRIVHTVTARLATPSQFYRWLGSPPGSVGHVLAGLAAVFIAAWLARPGRTVVSAITACGVLLCVAAVAAGLGGVMVIVWSGCAVLMLTATTRRTDLAWTACLILGGAALGLMPVLIGLADVL